MWTKCTIVCSLYDGNPVCHKGCVVTFREETIYQEWEPPQVISMLERELTLFIQIWDLCHLTGRKLILREGKCTS